MEFLDKVLHNQRANHNFGNHVLGIYNLVNFAEAHNPINWTA